MSESVTPRFRTFHPQKSSDAPLISRIFFYISWQSHNVWSTRTSRAAMRIWLQAIQPDIRNFDLSPHDLDICVTHLANSLDAWRWEVRYVILCTLSTYCLFIAHISFLRPLEDVRWLLIWAPTYSMCNLIRDYGGLGAGRFGVSW